MSPQKQQSRIGRRVKSAGILPATVLVLFTLFVAAAVLWIGFTRLLRDAWPWQEGGLETTTPTPGFQTTQLVLTLVAGIGGAILVVVAYRRQRDLELARFDERFAAAAAQLGAPTAAERLAGVYAMAALADTWEKHRQQCIDVLCGYLRLPYDPSNTLLKTVVSEHTWTVAGPGATGKETRTYEQLPNDREVRLSIISSITRHLRDGAPVSWQGHNLDFTGAAFDGGDFSEAIFSSGAVNFSKATFTGGQTSFYGAKFTGATVNFFSTEFTGGRVLFNAAEFSGAHVAFDLATFSGTHVTFSRATFTGGAVTFNEAQFSRGQVEFTEATFAAGGAVSFTEAQFTGGAHVAFDLATFTGGAVAFNEAQFTGGDISFTMATFAGGAVSFTETQFTGGDISFGGAKFTGGTVLFNEAKFSGTHVAFTMATFTGGHVIFTAATSTGGDISFVSAEFTKGVLTRDGAEFRGRLPPPEPEPVEPAAG